MEISITKLFRIFKSGILIIILISILFAAAGFAYTKYCTQPTYSSSMKLMLISESGVSNYTDITLVRRLVNTYIQMLDSRDYYEHIKKDLPYDLSAAQIKKMISYVSNDDSEAFSVTVTTLDPDQCSAIISIINKTAADYIIQKYDKVVIETIESPNVPAQSPSNTLRNTLLGFILGALISFGCLFLKSECDTRIKSEAEFHEQYDLPILGTVPDFTVKKKSFKKAKSDTTEREK